MKTSFVITATNLGRAGRFARAESRKSQRGSATQGLFSRLLRRDPDGTGAQPFRLQRSTVRSGRIGDHEVYRIVTGSTWSRKGAVYRMMNRVLREFASGRLKLSWHDALRAGRACGEDFPVSVQRSIARRLCPAMKPSESCTVPLISPVRGRVRRRQQRPRSSAASDHRPPSAPRGLRRSCPRGK